MIDRPPYFKIGAERTYALGSSVIARSYIFIRTVLPCRDVISVFGTDSSTSQKEMTLGRDTVGFACLSIRSAQRRRYRKERFRAVTGRSQVRRRNLHSRLRHRLFRICRKSDFKTYRICIIHGSGMLLNKIQILVAFEVKRLACQMSQKVC